MKCKKSDGVVEKDTRLNLNTLLITDVIVSLNTRIGRDDAKHVSAKDLDNMEAMFASNGGEILRLENLLIMRDFTNRVMGQQTLESITEELNTNDTLGKTIVFADYEEKANEHTYDVHALRNYPSIQKARNIASMWTMQDHPLVVQVGSQTMTLVEGSKVSWSVCLSTSDLEYKNDIVKLHSGDVYVKSLSSPFFTAHCETLNAR